MPAKKRPDPPVSRAAYSVRQFCEAFGISETTYFKLKSKGKGPREMRLGKRILISLEAADAWRRAREQS
jgi:predicted DNA-binding transcriptional regulator AlpA